MASQELRALASPDERLTPDERIRRTLDWLEHRDLSREQLRELLVEALAGSLAAADAVD